MPVAKQVRKNKPYPIYRNGVLAFTIRLTESCGVWIEWPDEDIQPLAGADAACEVEAPVAKSVDDCKGKAVG